MKFSLLTKVLLNIKQDIHIAASVSGITLKSGRQRLEFLDKRVI